MFLSDLIAEQSESIRTHHASGHFTYDVAFERLVANGVGPGTAAAMLAAPVGDDLFVKHRTWPKP